MIISNCGEQKVTQSETIPLPEHPRPDFMRERWVNLNGKWDFSLDSLEVGETEGWHSLPIKAHSHTAVERSGRANRMGQHRQGYHRTEGNGEGTQGVLW